MNLLPKSSLCIEIYKTISSLNPDFMKKNLEMKKNNWVARDRYKLNLNIPRIKQVMFANDSLKSYGPKIWNAQDSSKLWCF